MSSLTKVRCRYACTVEREHELLPVLMRRLGRTFPTERCCNAFQSVINSNLYHHQIRCSERRRNKRINEPAASPQASATDPRATPNAVPTYPHALPATPSNRESMYHASQHYDPARNAHILPQGARDNASPIRLCLLRGNARLLYTGEIKATR